ncbi:hypothetical protein JXD38_05005 [candidate division WOR-3 bacterium]|nr:hypothetical protein [candidate division WOR-3 bacterium]
MAKKFEVDAVVHSGDFGFFDDNSVDDMPEHYLNLHITRSRLPEETQLELMRLAPEDRRRIIRDGLVLSELPDLLSGDGALEVPVYTNWGAFEDPRVIAKFRGGEYAVENLHLLDEASVHKLEGLLLFGIGGGVHRDDRLLCAPTGDAVGDVHASLAQYGRLVESVAAAGDEISPRVLVCSTARRVDPLQLRLAVCCRANLLVGSNTGEPCGMVWNESAVRDLRETLGAASVRIRQLHQLSGDPPDQPGRLGNRAVLEMLGGVVGRNRVSSRLEVEPTWYQDMITYLPEEALSGYAIIETGPGRLGLELNIWSMRSPDI